MITVRPAGQRGTFTHGALVAMKCLALRTAKAITVPRGLTPGAPGSNEASLTHRLRIPHPP